MQRQNRPFDGDLNNVCKNCDFWSILVINRGTKSIPVETQGVRRVGQKASGAPQRRSRFAFGPYGDGNSHPDLRSAKRAPRCLPDAHLCVGARRVGGNQFVYLPEALSLGGEVA